MWRIIDGIKSGKITYSAGDKVMVFRRKSNGYPRFLEDKILYTVKSVHNHNTLELYVKGLLDVKVCKFYVINISKLRDFKINSIIINK